MENISQNTSMIRFSFANFVELIFFHKILNCQLGHWIPALYSRFLSFLRWQFEFVIVESNHDWRDTKKTVSIQMLSREDVEMEMAKMGLFCNPNVDGSVKEFFGRVEFSLLFEEVEPSLEEVKEAFCVFDLNKDGFIDAKELQKVLCSLGFREALNLDACERMIRGYDKNRDGRIDFNEFVPLMENSFE